MKNPANFLSWPFLRLPDGGRPSRALGGLIRYGFAAACVLAALSLTLMLQHVEAGRPTLFLFFAAIIASAWFGGTGAGAAAVLLSLPGGLYFYSASLGSFAHRPDNLILLLLFFLCAMAGGMLGSWRRRADAALALKAGQLQQANDALRAEIGERRRAEEALQEARAELARAARLTSLGELAATIAHEINQPLAAISANAGACVRWIRAAEPDLAEAEQSALCIVRDSARAAQVVERVRAMIRNALPQKTPVDVNRLIREALDSLAYDLQKHRVALQLSLDPDAALLMGDRVQLLQVFINIFLNALEAMAEAPQRRLAVVTRAQAEDIRIEISDSGGGFSVSPEMLFEPFFTTKPAGMGLGLPICRSIVEAHGGALTAVPSRQGAGFHLLLPRGG